MSESNSAAIHEPVEYRFGQKSTKPQFLEAASRGLTTLYDESGDVFSSSLLFFAKEDSKLRNHVSSRERILSIVLVWVWLPIVLFSGQHHVGGYLMHYVSNLVAIHNLRSYDLIC